MSATRGGRGAPATRRPHVAIVQRKGRLIFAEPLFEPGRQVALGREARKQEGNLVLVDFTPGQIRLLRGLGSPDKPRDVVSALLWERSHRGFRQKIEAVANEVSNAVSRSPGSRRDLTELTTFTVDPATARDFDDAVSVDRRGDGYQLWVHIADVAAHVKPGSGLDLEAAERANSTYVPGTVEPMLPRGLSDGACSLAPGVERLAVTTEIELSGDGRVGRVQFYRSLIRSDARLDYDQLDEIFAGRAEAPSAVREQVATARELAENLGSVRGETALEVDSREPEFVFDPDGYVISAKGVPQTEAHRLIERLMILTNEQVAEVMEKRRSPMIYRVHEQPDPQRIEQLVEQLASLDLPTPPLPKPFGPSEATRLAASASRMLVDEAKRRGHGRSAYTSLILRSLKQAQYSDRNLGHAGLASPAYCHFTSPIRRYADLIAHRALLAAMGEGEEAPSRAQVADAAVHCSEREREASKIERTADDVCSAFLLERELYEGGHDREFEGEVSGVIGAGAFVEFAGDLGDVYEGLVPARQLRGERFELNEVQTALIGAKTGRRVGFGDPIKVTVGRVEPIRGRVTLEPADG